jgi:hypothetical protein
MNGMLKVVGLSAAIVSVTLAQQASRVDPRAELKQKLLSAKRIFVEGFGEDPISRTLQAMIVDAVGSSARFIVTENRAKADLILKGAALEKTTEEFHTLASGTTVAGAAGGHSSQVSGSANAATASVSGSSSGGFVSRKLGISDSEASIETVNDARASVRLVSTDGDVVWSTTQESKGAKYKGATADVADKIIKQLLRDIAKAEEPVTGK